MKPMDLLEALRPRRRVPFIAQMEATECGAASLAMVLAYHGHHAPLPEVRAACGVSRDGAGAKGIVQAAISYQMDALCVSLSMDELRKTTELPAILHWNFAHFVVLERITKHHLEVVDPAIGRINIPIGEAAGRFTGVAILLETEDHFVKRAAKPISLLQMVQEASEARWMAWTILLASLGTQVLGMVSPMATQILFDEVITVKRGEWLLPLGAAMIAGFLLERALAISRAWLSLSMQRAMDRPLLYKVMDHLARVPMLYIDQRTTGDLSQRIAMITQVRSFVFSQGLNALLGLATLLVAGCLLVAYHPLLGLIVFAMACARLALLGLVRRENVHLAATELAAGAAEATILMDALHGLETLKAVRGEQALIDRWHPRMLARMDASIQREKINNYAAMAGAILQAIGFFVIYQVGSRAVMEHQLTLGALAAFFTLQGLFLGPLDTLASTYWAYLGLRGTMERLDDLLDTAPEEDGHICPTTLTGAITFSRVSFRYAESSPWAIRDISFKIAPGERIAIVGASGSGKSTLASMLIGLLRPTSGTIYIDQTPIQNYQRDALLRHIGVVPQEITLIAGTILDNLRMARPEATLVEVAEAARIAGIAEHIESLPDGYLSLLTEGGRNLSGGQRQRLVLARALVGGSSILLMDEATSALDLPMERAIHARLAERKCTRIVLAHRLATVEDADRVLVIERGILVDQGTPAELADRPGPYQTMLRLANTPERDA